MKPNKKLKVISVVCALLIYNSVTFAGTEQMNVTLVRINTILNQINPLINLAQKQQNPNARIQFQFNVLRNDIANIQAGIAQAVNHVSIQPRIIQPLVGDYLPAPQSTSKNNEGETS